MFSKHAGCLDIEHTDNSALKSTGKNLAGGMVRNGTGTLIRSTKIIELEKQIQWYLIKNPFLHKREVCYFLQTDCLNLQFKKLQKFLQLKF